jgi:hypothetical protein
VNKIIVLSYGRLKFLSLLRKDRNFGCLSNKDCEELYAWTKKEECSKCNEILYVWTKERSNNTLTIASALKCNTFGQKKEEATG